MSNLRRVASHEAGHALALLSCGVELGSVSIDADEGATVYHGTMPPDVSMFVGLAGREAEMMLSGPNGAPHVHHESDYAMTWHAARHAVHYSSDAAAASAMERSRRAAAAFVHEHADQIAALAAELAYRGRMTGRECHEFLMGSPAPAGW
jgi:hypothetical protein